MFQNETSKKNKTRIQIQIYLANTGWLWHTDESLSKNM